MPRNHAKITQHQVSRPAPQNGRIQTRRGEFVSEVQELQSYGLQHHLPEGAKSINLKPEGEAGRLSILGFAGNPYGLEEGELALYSEHGQVLYYLEDGTIHLEAAGKLSIHSDEEDLYSLLKDLIEAVKGLQTAQIDTQVNGGAVALAPSGSSPVVNAAGTNAGVGLNAQSSQKLDEIAQRLDKLLQKGKKPPTAEEQEHQREQEAEHKTAEGQANKAEPKNEETPANQTKYVSLDVEIRS